MLGNVLEVLGVGGKPMPTLSDAANDSGNELKSSSRQRIVIISPTAVTDVERTVLPERSSPVFSPS